MPDNEQRPDNGAPNELPSRGETAQGGENIASPRILLNVDGIPADLRAMPQWVCWQIKPPKKPGDKFGKVPINPHTGGAASSTDAKTWSTFPDALARMERDHLDGVGFVFADDGTVGVDLDHCRDPISGAIDPWAMEIVQKLDTYTEISPSGTGLHLIGRGELPPGGNRKGKIEMYARSRFFTITGVALPGTPPDIADFSDALAAVHAEVFGTAKKEDIASGAPIGPGVDDDEKLIERAGRAKNGPKFKALFGGDISGYASPSEADLALCNILAHHTKGDALRIDRLFRRSGLFRPKWDERHGDSTYGETTIRKAVASTRPADTDEPKQASFIGRFRPATDSGNAERYVDQFGNDMRHCHAWKKWLLYRGGYWQLDDAGIALARSKHVARLILTEAASCEDKAVRTALIEHSHRTEKAERRKAMVDLARCESRIPILHTQLDRHPYLLNCANGTLDLETFKKHDHRASDYLTKQCPTAYVPDAQCPLWLQTIERVLPDERVRAYLQRYFGYALTGDVSEQVLLTALGVGANGKSTIMCTIQDVLSSAYAIQIATDMLLTKDRESHPTDLADLFGVRLAIGTETPKGRALDERLVKQLTGGEPIRARRMREDFWEFPPSHKFILVTNHMPEVSADDYAVTRRLHVLRFDVTIPEADRDKQLLRKLKREREGILAWAVEGRRMQLEQGLAAPDEVLFKPSTATETKSPPEEFIASFVVRQPGSRTRASVLFDAYTSWCGRNNKPIASQQDFGSMLGRLGFGSKKSEGVIVYVDTLLRPDREDQGPQGPLLPLNVLSTPREGVNGESGPSHPYSSLKRSRRIEETASECVLSQLRAGTCYTCGGMRFWRARDGTHWTCGTCAPPSKDLADPVWSDGASHA